MCHCRRFARKPRVYLSFYHPRDETVKLDLMFEHVFSSQLVPKLSGFHREHNKDDIAILCTLPIREYLNRDVPHQLVRGSIGPKLSATTACQLQYNGMIIGDNIVEFCCLIFTFRFPFMVQNCCALCFGTCTPQ